MAILRTRHRLISSAPPPSPIATAKGLRSAAVDDKVLSEYLERTLQIPDLTLPEFCFPENARSWIPSRVDLRSLISKDEDSIRQVLGSAAEFGTFLIIGHGISADELQSMLLEAKCAPEIPAEKRRIINRNLNGRGEVHEELFWFCAGEGKKETLREEIGPDRYRRFSKNTDNIESKLEAIADAVGQILFQHKRVQHQLDGINTRGSVICFHRLIANPNATTTRDEDDDDEREHTSSHHHALLSLHLHPSDQEFDVQTRQGLLSFTAGADTIVVTIGKQLEDTRKAGYMGLWV
ncbi:PREDICTED: uncharacterized protein LOC104594514 isoform X2 [Nelumbo nucifera]|uniref:Non-haem dioxygenase N-terminal domain-containing protein n=2 Tax=Nelumbo nucifera TaxID=4432 RepID=A0A822XVZ9_NELNU|nr:PREDICTED: uncharacterized protein LOC104594514 isoform X2 [Nelumbo nucifera]DAD25814.1 TPA_asm: hypothetical protein HUJ06_027282 [Nelumbo nucifera]